MLSNVELCINLSSFRSILLSPLINRHGLSSHSVGHSKPTAAWWAWPSLREENLADTAACSMLLLSCMALSLSVGLTIIFHQLYFHSEKPIHPLASLVQRTLGSCQPWETSMWRLVQARTKWQKSTQCHLLLGNVAWHPTLPGWQQCHRPGTAIPHTSSAVPLAVDEPENKRNKSSFRNP